MKLERPSSQSPVQTLGLSPVDGTHNLLAPARSTLRPHTDESITPDRLPPLRTPLRQGALLLAIYVALYGTMGLLIAAANALASEIEWPTFAPARDDAVRPSAGEGALTSIDEALACARA